LIKLANPLLQSLFACFKSLFACYIYITICAAKTAALCESSVGVCRFAFFGDSKFKWCMEKLLRMRGQEENRMRFLEMLLREL